MGELETGAAVISGAGTGIGREIAVALGRRGYELALLGRRRGPLEATLEAAGGRGLALACDVRDAASVEAARKAIREGCGAVEVVVPAAGVAHVEGLDTLPPERFREQVDTNLTGAFLLLRAFLPAMKARGRGWIFPILSVAARQGFPGWGGYCASKWGLAGLVAALRAELAGSGVRVSALYPGATATPIWDNLAGEWNREAMIRPEEVARAVLWTLDADPSTVAEEIHLSPAGGAL